MLSRAILLPLVPIGEVRIGRARAAKFEIKSLDDLNRSARQRVTATARVPLAAESDEAFTGIDSLEASGRAPNYLRAMAYLPNFAKPFATAFKTYFYGGTIAPEIKMAMGLRIAQIHGSPYVATQMQISKQFAAYTTIRRSSS